MEYVNALKDLPARIAAFVYVLVCPSMAHRRMFHAPVMVHVNSMVSACVILVTPVKIASSVPVQPIVAPSMGTVHVTAKPVNASAKRIVMVPIAPSSSVMTHVTATVDVSTIDAYVSQASRGHTANKSCAHTIARILKVKVNVSTVSVSVLPASMASNVFIRSAHVP